MLTSVEIVGSGDLVEKRRRTASGFMCALRATSAFERLSSIRRSSNERGEWIDPDLPATPFADWAHGWITTRTPSQAQDAGRLPFAPPQSHHPPVRWCPSRSDRPALDRAVGGGHAGVWAVGLLDQAGAQSPVTDLEGGGPQPVHPANPADGIALPRKPKREQLFLNPAEVDRLPDAVSDRYRALVYVLAYGGLRWGEAARPPTPPSRPEPSVPHRGDPELSAGDAQPPPRHLVRLRSRRLVLTASDGSPLRNSYFTRNAWQPALQKTELPSAHRGAVVPG